MPSSEFWGIVPVNVPFTKMVKLSNRTHGPCVCAPACTPTATFRQMAARILALPVKEDTNSQSNVLMNKYLVLGTSRCRPLLKHVEGVDRPDRAAPFDGVPKVPLPRRAVTLYSNEPRQRN
jgi:hypothetical protein